MLYGIQGGERRREERGKRGGEKRDMCLVGDVVRGYWGSSTGTGLVLVLGCVLTCYSLCQLGLILGPHLLRI
jgi:hypothetical protein